MKISSIGYATIGNAVTASAGGLAYLTYSESLQPYEFAIYSACIALGRFGATILDSGFKVKILKENNNFSTEDRTSILTLTIAIGVAIIFATILTGVVGVHNFNWSVQDTLIVSLYLAAYIASYPLILFSLASAELNGKFKSLSIQECIANSVELLGPALLLETTDLGLYSFPVGAWTGRCLRLSLILHDNPVQYSKSTRATFHGSIRFAKDALLFQFALVSNGVRDNLYLGVIGGMLGKSILGYYSWSLQICAMASQILIAAAFRVQLSKLPNLSNHQDKDRYLNKQILNLLRYSLGFGCIAMLLAPKVSSHIFDGKWDHSLIVLPFLAFRLLTNAITTPSGSRLLIDFGTSTFLSISAAWTAIEILAFTTLTYYFGMIGAGVATAIGGIAGACLLLAKTLPRQRRNAMLFELITDKTIVWLAIGFSASIYFCQPHTATSI